MANSKTLSFLGVMTVLILTGCGGGSSSAPVQPATPPPPAVVEKGNRIMEIDVNMPADQDYVSAYDKARVLGMDSVSISMDWTIIEIGLDQTTNPPTPIYETVPDKDLLAITEGCFPASQMKISLTLRPVLTLVKNTPPDLANLPLNDPAVVTRFKQLIDHVYAKIPNVDLTSLVIGSEVDLYLSTDTLKAEYLDFYQQVSGYARTQYALLYPNKSPLNIAVESTFDGLTNSATASYYQQLNQFSDVIGVSYYPMQANGQVKPVTTVETDFQALISNYPNKLLYFFQLGYPSGYYSGEFYPEVRAGNASSMIGSSEMKQADFITAVFNAWDKHINEVGMIDFTWLHDLSEADVIATTTNPAFGGTSNPAPVFAEFLRTLGLRTNDGSNSSNDNGSDKAAYTRLLSESRARNWPVNPTTFTCQ